MTEQQECMELCLGKDNEPDVSIWVRMGIQTKMVEVLWYVSATDLQLGISVAFFRQLEEAPCLQALVLVGDFNHSYIWWKDNTEVQSRRFLKCITSTGNCDDEERPLYWTPYLQRGRTSQLCEGLQGTTLAAVIMRWWPWKVRVQDAERRKQGKKQDHKSNSGEQCPIQVPTTKPGCPELQSCIRPGPECIQGWGIHNILGHPWWGREHLLSDCKKKKWTQIKEIPFKHKKKLFLTEGYQTW